MNKLKITLIFLVSFLAKNVCCNNDVVVLNLSSSKARVRFSYENTLKNGESETVEVGEHVKEIKSGSADLTVSFVKSLYFNAQKFMQGKQYEGEGNNVTISSPVFLPGCGTFEKTLIIITSAKMGKGSFLRFSSKDNQIGDLVNQAIKSIDKCSETKKDFFSLIKDLKNAAKEKADNDFKESEKLLEQNEESFLKKAMHKCFDYADYYLADHEKEYLKKSENQKVCKKGQLSVSFFKKNIEKAKLSIATLLETREDECKQKNVNKYAAVGRIEKGFCDLLDRHKKTFDECIIAYSNDNIYMQKPVFLNFEDCQSPTKAGAKKKKVYTEEKAKETEKIALRQAQDSDSEEDDDSAPEAPDMGGLNLNIKKSNVPTGLLGDLFSQICAGVTLKKVDIPEEKEKRAPSDNFGKLMLEIKRKTFTNCKKETGEEGQNPSKNKIKFPKQTKVSDEDKLKKLMGYYNKPEGLRNLNTVQLGSKLELAEAFRLFYATKVRACNQNENDYLKKDNKTRAELARQEKDKCELIEKKLEILKKKIKEVSKKKQDEYKKRFKEKHSKK
ncbi:hypothetical protein ACFLYA_00290 [Candidatus Dependentiae bacterium]